MAAKTAIQIPIKSSYFKIPHPLVISATERNLKARANSKNPSTTFTEFIQLPDLGKVLSQAGKAANNPNGNANAEEKPSITKKGPMYSPLVAACTIAAVSYTHLDVYKRQFPNKEARSLK